MSRTAAQLVGKRNEGGPKVLTLLSLHPLTYSLEANLLHLVWLTLGACAYECQFFKIAHNEIGNRLLMRDGMLAVSTN